MGQLGRLVAFRRDAIALANKPSVTRAEVDEWRERTRAAMEDIFGPEATPAREFSRIRFDDDAIVDMAERVLREKAGEAGVDLGDQQIGLPPAATALRRGLEAAAELLLSLTLRAE